MRGDECVKAILGVNVRICENEFECNIDKSLIKRESERSC